MIQYMLWKNCKHHCKFCTLSEKELDTQKMVNLNYVYNLMDKEEVKNYSKIAFIGGEIFHYIDETPEIKEMTYKIFAKAFSFIDNPDYKIQRFMIMTNLLYDFSYLQELIDFAGKNKDKIVICTSYDINGRFQDKDELDLFLKNFNKLKELGITTHIEMILSKSLINAVNNNEFNIKQFMNDFTDNLDFITPYKSKVLEISDEDFFPTRESFLNFLNKVFIQEKSYPYRRFLFKANHSNLVYRYHMGQVDIERDRVKSNFYLPSDKKNYIDSDITMFKDYQFFKKLHGLV